MVIDIVRSMESDAGRLAEVFNLSFCDDYLKYGECLGYNKTEETMLSNMKNHEVYSIIFNRVIVGAISVKRVTATDYFLGALCVIPEYANKGIGQQAIKFLERQYRNATHWRLETPMDKVQNHYFYKKFGFEITKVYKDGNVLVALFDRWG